MPSVMIHVIPDNVRTAVERDAIERDVSLRFLVNSVVASALGMSYAGPKGYGLRSNLSPTAKWVIDFPALIADALDVRAKEAGAAKSRLIVAMLAEHYSLPIPSPKDQRSVSQPRDGRGRFGQRSR